MSEPVYTESAHLPESNDRWRWMVEAAHRGADKTGAQYFEIEFERKTMIVTINGWLERKEGEGK